jgi:hypothetical protein
MLMAKSNSRPDGFFDGYASFAGVLRTWLIAYGIGGPVLFVTQTAIAGKLSVSGHAREIALLFLVGVFLQVIIALLYKGAMWYLYIGEEQPELQKTGRYRIAYWLSSAFWFEMLFDLSSIGLFVYATFRVLSILTASADVPMPR